MDAATSVASAKSGKTVTTESASFANQTAQDKNAVMMAVEEAVALVPGHGPVQTNTVCHAIRSAMVKAAEMTAAEAVAAVVRVINSVKMVSATTCMSLTVHQDWIRLSVTSTNVSIATTTRIHIFSPIASAWAGLNVLMLNSFRISAASEKVRLVIPARPDMSAIGPRPTFASSLYPVTNFARLCAKGLLIAHFLPTAVLH